MCFALNLASGWDANPYALRRRCGQPGHITQERLNAGFQPICRHHERSVITGLMDRALVLASPMADIPLVVRPAVPERKVIDNGYFKFVCTKEAREPVEPIPSDYSCIAVLDTRWTTCGAVVEEPVTDFDEWMPMCPEHAGRLTEAIRSGTDPRLARMWKNAIAEWLEECQWRATYVLGDKLQLATGSL